jgi:deoxyguanosine kinase
MAPFRLLTIEGVIGVGKTSLARRLARDFGAELVLEEVERNPFLSDFYTDMRAYAFQTQIFFLLSRHRQMRDLAQTDLFVESVVTDYLFAKDQIFAQVTLDENELALYQRLLVHLERDIPQPDLVVYLQADSRILLERIRQRGRRYERNISLAYLQELTEMYNRFFFHYDRCPLLVVNTNNIDFVANESDFQQLKQEVEHHRHGIRYYIPSGDREE